MSEPTDRSSMPGPRAGPVAQSGSHTQSGRTFSPRDLIGVRAEEDDHLPVDQIEVPIGRPFSESVYEAVKEAAETAPPDPRGVPGREDTAVRR